MSGHSKWSQIKRQKGVADVRRAGLFTKLANAIAVAARTGKDPAANFRLRLAIEAARSANMPNDNIERAIKRGAGELAGQAAIEEIVYEAYGPGGAALIIRTLTDNRNRTSGTIRSILSRQGGNLGQAGSVLWLFSLRGVLRITREETAGRDTSPLSLAAIDAGAVDIKEEPEGITVLAEPSQLNQIQSALISAGFPKITGTLEYVPTTPTTIDQTQENKLASLIEELEALDDVDAVFTNAAI